MHSQMDDLTNYPGPLDQRPQLLVPPEVLRLPADKTYEYFIIQFYKTFRKREKFDKVRNGRKTPLVDLEDIHKCYVHKFNQTVEKWEAGLISIPPRVFCRSLLQPSNWWSFRACLIKLDEGYMVQLQLPIPKRDRSMDMRRIHNHDDRARIQDPWFFGEPDPAPRPVVRLLRDKPVVDAIVESVFRNLQ